MDTASLLDALTNPGGFGLAPGPPGTQPAQTSSGAESKAVPVQTQLPSAAVENLQLKTRQLVRAISELRALLLRSEYETPTWPDVLGRYSIILSLSSTLTASIPDSLRRLVIHPAQTLADGPADGHFSTLIKTLQTTEVLDTESRTVQRVQDALGSGSALPATLEKVRKDHDNRVKRAADAVQQLLKGETGEIEFDWKERIRQDSDELNDEGVIVVSNSAHALEAANLGAQSGEGDAENDADTDMEMDGEDDEDDEGSEGTGEENQSERAEGEGDGYSDDMDQDMDDTQDTLDAQDDDPLNEIDAALENMSSGPSTPIMAPVEPSPPQAEQ